MPIPAWIRNGASADAALGVWTAGQIASWVVVYAVAFLGYGDRFVRRVLGKEPLAGHRIRWIYVTLSFLRTVSQIFWAFYVRNYAFPAGYATLINFYTVLVDTIGILGVIANRKEPSLSDIVFVGVFLAGLVLERASEIQRTIWKSLPINKGKPHMEGLFSLAVHVNYTGYSIWRTALYALTHSFVLMIIPAIIIANFNGEVHEQYERNVAKYGEPFKEYWDRTPKMFPGIY